MASPNREAISILIASRFFIAVERGEMLDELVAELARLYDDSESARRIAGDAGIPAQLVEVDGKPVDFWRRIVDLANRRGTLPNLLRVAVREYANNVTLQRMYGSFVYPSSNPGESQLAVGQPRNDADALSRLERSVTKLDQIISGTEWNKGDDGILAVNKQIKKDLAALAVEVAALAVEVHDIKSNWVWVKWTLIVLVFLVPIIGIVQFLSLSGVWGNLG